MTSMVVRFPLLALKVVLVVLVYSGVHTSTDDFIRVGEGYRFDSFHYLSLFNPLNRIGYQSKDCTWLKPINRSNLFTLMEMVGSH